MPGTTPPRLALPDGLTTRPLRPTDSRAVFELMAAQELADTGRVAIEESDIIIDWARPSHDLAGRSVGVPDGEQLVAYAELMGADRADTSVLPSHRGRGIGTWLARWLQQLGREGATIPERDLPPGYTAWPGHCWSTPSPPYDDSGTTTSELSTDCRTGALGLCERVRMVVDQVWVNRGITLT